MKNIKGILTAPDNLKEIYGFPLGRKYTIMMYSTSETQSSWLDYYRMNRQSVPNIITWADHLGIDYEILGNEDFKTYMLDSQMLS